MNDSGDSSGAGPSKKGNWTILAGAVLLLAALAAPHLLTAKESTSASGSRPVAPIATTTATGRSWQSYEYRGVAIQLPSSDTASGFEQFVEEIAATGANTICLSVAAYQENAASSSIFIDQRRTPSPDYLDRIIAAARAKGMRITFMPIVLLENPGSGEWRGLIKPHDPAIWWESYENYILHFAKIAQANHLEMFMVGSELVSLEDETERWKTLIAKVRKVYSGTLSYSANWDHYKNIQYWSDLDVVGMTTYHDLCGEKKPGMEVLLDTWKPIKKEILDWQKTVGRPILFTEVGWPNLESAAKEPWNYVKDAKSDPELQARCFDAFFRTWENEKAVAGLFVWEWRNYPGLVGGPTETSYYPGGKPAMEIIKHWFKRMNEILPPASAAATATSAPATTVSH